MRLPALLLFLVGFAPGQDYVLTKATCSGASGTSSSPSFVLLGALGQPVVGTASNGHLLQVGFYTPDLMAPSWLCGDLNHDGQLTVEDAQLLAGYLFDHGDPPSPWILGDTNGDGSVTPEDLVYFMAYLYHTGPAPACGSQIRARGPGRPAHRILRRLSPKRR